MVSHPILRNAVAIAVMRQDGLLPLAETVQGLVGVVVNLQVRLRGTTQHNTHMCRRVQQCMTMTQHNTASFSAL